MFEAVFFDIDDTLLDDSYASREAALRFKERHAEFRDYSSEDFIGTWNKLVQKHFPRFLSGEVSYSGQRRERLRELFGPALSLGDDEADAIYAGFLADYEANWRAFPDVDDCLENLRGLKVGIISNGELKHQRRKLASMGLLSLFDPIVIATPGKLAKPDPKIFHLACDLAGLAPAQCCLIGDNLKTDAEAAQKAGLTGVWLNRGSNAAVTHICMVRSLREFAALVRSLSRNSALEPP